MRTDCIPHMHDFHILTVSLTKPSRVAPAKNCGIHIHDKQSIGKVQNQVNTRKEKKRNQLYARTLENADLGKAPIHLSTSTKYDVSLVARGLRYVLKMSPICDVSHTRSHLHIAIHASPHLDRK